MTVVSWQKIFVVRIIFLSALSCSTRFTLVPDDVANASYAMRKVSVEIFLAFPRLRSPPFLMMLYL